MNGRHKHLVAIGAILVLAFALSGGLAGPSVVAESATAHKPALQPPVADTPFLMMIEDAYTFRGFGTVITGLVAQGTIETSDQAEILTQDDEVLDTKILGIDIVKGKGTTIQAQTGDKVALLLTNPASAKIAAGMVLAQPGTVKSHADALSKLKGAGTGSPTNDADECTTRGRRYTGTVAWFRNQKGYGYIERKNGDDLFVHHSEIVGKGYRTLEKGQEVEFAIGTGDKGPEAVCVVVIDR